MRLLTLSFSLLIGSTLVLSSCKKIFIPNTSEDGKYNTFKGPEVKVGEGSARTFATISHSGVPQEVGVIFTDEALLGLPASNTTYVLNLDQKATEATLFKNVVVGLSASGHGLPPTGNIEAHFDVRFFMMSNEEREAIPAPAAPLVPPAGAGFDANPPPGYLPENYVMSYAVAKIGRHWASNTFAAGNHVEHTMAYGTYNGELTFIAPIVTVAALTAGNTDVVAYAQPLKFAKHGYYATKYNIYEDDKGRHYITLSDFVWR